MPRQLGLKSLYAESKDILRLPSNCSIQNFVLPPPLPHILAAAFAPGTADYSEKDKSTKYALIYFSRLMCVCDFTDQHLYYFYTGKWFNVFAICLFVCLLFLFAAVYGWIDLVPPFYVKECRVSATLLRSFYKVHIFFPSKMQMF